MKLSTTYLKCPLGTIALVTDGAALCELRFEDGEAEPQPATTGHPAAERLNAYFAGDPEALDTIEVSTQGTDFQRMVWAELRRIPPGQTVSYRELAQRIGHPKAVRAVGAANGANPVALVVPCHRVIGSDGHLTGYAYGLERKRWLLEHEASLVRTPG